MNEEQNGRWDVPHSWQWIRIEELGQIVGGGTPKAGDPTNFSSDGIPWVTPADLTGYTASTIERGARNLSERGLATSSAKVVPAGTVLFTSRAPIGYCTVAANPISTNQGFKSVVLGGGLNPFFLRNYLRSAKEYAEQNASGTTFLELSGARMKELLAPIAPLNEQKRIVVKIEALQRHTDAAKEALDAIPPLLEKFRQSVLAAAFRGDLTKAWRAANPDVEPATELLKRIRAARRARWIEDAAEKARARAQAKAVKAGKPWGGADDAAVLKTERVKAAKKYKEPEPVVAEGLPELPQGWCWVTLGDVARFFNGDRSKNYPHRSEYVEFGVPFINTGHIDPDGSLSDARMNYISRTRFESLSGGRIQTGDLVYCLRGATLGKTALVEPLAEGAIASSLVIIRPNDATNYARYFYYFLVGPLGRAEIKKYDNGSAQPNLAAASVTQYILPMPPRQEMATICELLSDATTDAADLNDHARRSQSLLDSLNQSILAKAFRGELVPQDPNDEPASVLLERIRAERDAEEAARPKKKRRTSAYRGNRQR